MYIERPLGLPAAVELALARACCRDGVDVKQVPGP